MVIVGNWIADVINHMSDESVREKIREEVREMCKGFCFY